MINGVDPWSDATKIISWFTSERCNLFIGWKFSTQGSPKKKRDFEWDIFMPNGDVDSGPVFLLSYNIPSRRASK